MFLNKKAQTKGIISGILILVLGGLILGWLTGIFNTPHIVRIVQNNEEVCPANLNFNYDDLTTFKITLKNEGNTGSVYVSIESANLSARAKDTEEFSNSSRETWSVSSGETQQFDFDIYATDYPQNLSIKVDYGCTSLLCAEKTFCCNYLASSSKVYKFVKETSDC